MNLQSKIGSTEYADLNKVTSWFITLRWIACGGVLSALVLVDFFLQYNLPYLILYLLTSCLVTVNIFFTIYYFAIKGKTLSRNELGTFFHIQIILDYLFLFLLIYFTGFLNNPFTYYFVFHILLTAFIFPQRTVFLYAGILVAVFISASLLTYFAIIPSYRLTPLLIRTVRENSLFLRTLGLCTTILISSYLITSIKKRIEERGRRIEVELDRYKGLDKIKSNFILQVTHELRGPLAALMGYHEMIMKGITGEIEPKTMEVLKRGNRRTENLLTMIDEMIDFAYMKTEEEVRYEKCIIPLKTSIDYNIDMFKTRAARKNLDILSSCPRDLEINASRDLLNIILNNLISNAVKYSPEGKTIRVIASADSENIELTIKDEGMGIEADELDKVFDEFYRTRRAREIEKDGTGLGLPIVQRAVDTLDGKIMVYSEVGKGTSFHLRFPKPPYNTEEEEN